MDNQVSEESQIIRRVRVNRNRSPQEALNATRRKQYTDREVVNRMPNGEGDEVEIVFFKPDLPVPSYISDDDLEKEYELRDLTPADPYSLIALNEADPVFADEKPHATHWKNADGNWCFASFNRDARGIDIRRFDSDWDDERNVDVHRRGDVWDDRWWFAGVRR